MNVSRRRFLAQATAGVGALWLPGAARAASGPAAPPGFPADIAIGRATYENWARQLSAEGLWTATPRTADDVAAIVNWAAGAGYRVRPRGRMHGWSPLTVVPGTTGADRVVLVDTTTHLTGVEMRGDIVRAGAGTQIDDVLATLEASGRALTATPAPGDITLGGALAIDAHGTAIPARGETPLPGRTYGSLSNLVVALKAVVWSERHHRYVVRRFERSQAECAALLVHVGRAFVVEAELMTGPATSLRCVSILDVPAAELLGQGAGRTLQSYVEDAGRAEVIWFPFTSSPWLKVWSVAPAKPAGSTAVGSPYNYVFADVVPTEVSDLARKLIEGFSASTPTYGQLQYDVSVVGLQATRTSDIWGPAKNSQLYVLPTTIRETANGYAVICRRADIQRVVNEFYAFHTARIADYRARGLYPVNMPVEIRITGLDHHGDAGIPHATTPHLSALRPLHDHPERDVAVWIDVLTFPTTQGSQTYYRELEQFFFSNYSSYALVRPEWSKGWGFDGHSGWADATVIGKTIPAAYGTAWKKAAATLKAFDPHGVYGNALLDRLFA